MNADNVWIFFLSYNNSTSASNVIESFQERHLNGYYQSKSNERSFPQMFAVGEPICYYSSRFHDFSSFSNQFRVGPMNDNASGNARNTMLGRLSTAFILCIMSLSAAARQREASPEYLASAKFIGVPLVNYSRSFEFMIGGLAGIYYPMNKNDSISPPSLSGGAAFYATNGSYGVLVFSKLYYAEDRFRTYGAVGAPKINFQFYNWDVGIDNGFINYTTLARFIALSQLFRVSESWYAGPDFSWFRATTSFGQEGFTTSERTYASLGIAGEYDTRPSKTYPRAGWYTTLRLRRYADWLGSAAEFTKLKIELNRYLPVDSTDVLAIRATIQTALGAVPFEAQTVVGGKDIRGYSQGKYRGDEVYAAQGEYRWNFAPPFGAVGFFGLALAVTAGNPVSFDDLLPGVGAGFRYTMIPSINANVGVDAAVGRDDWGLYFRIAEAF